MLEDKEKKMTKIITIGQTEMIRVGRDYPCPICGKPDWCLVFADQTKAVCARKIDLDKPQFGSAGTIYDLDPKKSTFGKYLNTSQGKFSCD